MDTATGLSKQTGTLGRRVEELVAEHARFWGEAADGETYPKKAYPRAVKKTLERELTSLVEKVVEGKKAADASGRLDAADFERIAGDLRPGLGRIVGLVDLPIASVYDDRFVDSTREFLKRVRSFDPDLRIEPVYQALRNVWIMNTLQFDLELEVRVTDSIFGYSLIYPYLDNFLDDPAVSAPAKLGLVARLGAWLEGEDETPESPLERKLRALVAGIEGQFPRDRFPGVFRSLLAIYNAQIKSLSQQERSRSWPEEDLLKISLEKGGTSVLADGYLAAGTITPGQERFCFGFGTILQLADDLQDLGEDSLSGSSTIFSGPARGRRLDDLVRTLCRYAFAVASAELDPGRPGEAALRELIPKGCTLMILEAAGKYRERFSRRGLREFQKSFPVRFSYLRSLRKRLKGRVLTGRETIKDLDPFTVALMTISSRAFALD